MTVTEALEMVKRVGAVEVNGEKLKLIFPEKERATLEPAIHTLRRCKAEALALLAALPPPAEWPYSLSELAAELAQRSGDSESARREVWHSWADFKAATLNRLFQELGTSGKPGRITAVTVRHGERKRST